MSIILLLKILPLTLLIYDIHANNTNETSNTNNNVMQNNINKKNNQNKSKKNNIKNKKAKYKSNTEKSKNNENKGDDIDEIEKTNTEKNNDNKEDNEKNNNDDSENKKENYDDNEEDDEDDDDNDENDNEKEGDDNDDDEDNNDDKETDDDEDNDDDEDEEDEDNDEEYDEYANNDILEEINRRIFKFNDNMDKFLNKIISSNKNKDNNKNKSKQSNVSKAVGNFAHNFFELPRVINYTLQGNVKNTANSIARLFINTLFGFFGVTDVAEKLGFKKNRTYFGDTLKKWGMKPGPYVVLPIFGPTSLRGALGQLFDTLPMHTSKLPLQNLSPLLKNTVYYAIYCSDLLVKRSAYSDMIEQVSAMSKDKYKTFRSITMSMENN